MKNLIILFLALVLFSSCEVIYYKGQFYKPLYSKSFTQKPDNTFQEIHKIKPIDSVVVLNTTDTIPVLKSMSIDTLKAKINRHELTYNKRTVYSQQQVGIRAKVAKKSNVIGYVREDKNKTLMYLIFGSLIIYSILTLFLTIFASIMLFYFLFDIDNN